MLATLRQLLHIDPYGNLLQDRTGERLGKLLSPRWVISRIMLTVHERRHPDEPWITRDAVKAFEALIRPHHIGLEWGSGKGTAWIARRCATLTSIEHYKPWYDVVSAALQEAGCRNVDYRFVEETAYCAAIDGIAEQSLDFVVVDGLFRDEAFIRSIPRIKPGGFIVFDNVNWYLPSASRTVHSRSVEQGALNALFADGAARVKDWKTLWTTNGVNDTAIFIRPQA